MTDKLQPYIPRKMPRQIKEKQKKQRPEARFQDAAIKLLLLHKFFVFRVNAAAAQMEGRYIRSIVCSNTGKTAGVSDILAMRDGRGFWIECKSKRGSYSDDQREFAAMAESKGIPVYGCNSIEQVQAIIEAFQRGEECGVYIAPTEKKTPRWARPKEGQSVQNYLFNNGGRSSE
jgi:hypothetical protein